jgi:YgiT-type zinc finger domain-containing protein
VKCVICRFGETKPANITTSYSDNGTTLVVKDVPADVCGTCGEEYLADDVARRLLDLLNQMEERGVEIDVRRYDAA